MSAESTKTLLERQVDLTKAVLEQIRGMEGHLISRVTPYLGAWGKEVIDDLRDAMDLEDGIDPNLAIYLDNAIVEIRKAIAAGTTEEHIAIPRERLIGCTEAFDTRTVLTPAAEALQAALPPLVQLYGAATQALDHAEAIRLSIRLIDRE
ncbi:MAG: hypothetical protein ACOCX2_09160 [Armatimonadota bacterium]